MTYLWQCVMADGVGAWVIAPTRRKAYSMLRRHLTENGHALEEGRVQMQKVRPMNDISELFRVEEGG